MNSEHKELEEALLENLNATEETLDEWATNPYYLDGNIVRSFWDKVKNAPAVGLVGDYDADGICALKIMMRSIKEICPDIKKVMVRTPRRFTEGYGINPVIADEIRSKLPKGSVIITVDNGVTAKDVLEGLEKDGYTVLMTDHHELREGSLPPNVTMAINPAVPELADGFSFTDWCGAAVAFKLCEQMVSADIAKELEIYAGIATVCDQMPLRGGNWGLVRKAISSFRDEKAPGVLYDMLVALGRDPKFTTEDTFGYYLGPCFNAAGRLDDKGATKVLGYLHSPSEEKLAELIKLNNDRKELKQASLELIEKYIDDNDMRDNCPMVVYLDNLHEGITGILAGEVAEKYGVPSIVLTNSNGVLKGSGRTAGTFDLFNYMQSCSAKYQEENSTLDDLYLKMGGHPGAVGLSITPENLEKFKAYQIDKDAVAFANEQKSATHIEPYEIPEINKILYKYRPFGEKNPEPVFELDVNLSKENTKMMGEKGIHLCIEGENKAYKITHFYHIPNELKDSNCFGMTGVISGNAFAGRETPTFNAIEVHDIVVTRYDKPQEYDPRDEELLDKR